MANNIMHIYMPQEDIDKLAEEATKLGLSLAAVVRGAIYHTTKGLTDFSGMREWANLRARGKPRVTTSTGSQQNDVSWELLKRNMSGQTHRFLQQLAALEKRGLSLDEAIELALVTEVDPTPEEEAVEWQHSLSHLFSGEGGEGEEAPATSSSPTLPEPPAQARADEEEGEEGEEVTDDQDHRLL